MPIADFFDRHWRPLTFSTILLLIVALGILALNQITTGTPMPLGIELTGGKQIMLSLNRPNLSAAQAALPGMQIQTVGNSLLIEVQADVNETEIIAKLAEAGISGESSIRTIGPTLGAVFWQQAQIGLVIAFVAMAVVVFMIFRSPVPSLAIMLAALTDICVAAALLSLAGVQLSLAVLAGMLMLIGYSVDTDIVLTTELLRSPSSELRKKIRAAAKTGLTMTCSALAAIAVMWVFATSAGMFVIAQIAIVLLIGLTVDIPATWLTNAGILRWWIISREKAGV